MHFIEYPIYIKRVISLFPEKKKSLDLDINKQTPYRIEAGPTLDFLQRQSNAHSGCNYNNYLLDLYLLDKLRGNFDKMPNTYDEGEEKSASEKFTFFCDMSMQEFSFGVGSIGVNGLCLGMMLNIPTLTLHNLMYKVAPKGILQSDTTDHERVWVARVVIDHWYKSTADWPPKKRFQMLYDAFKMLKEKHIAEELKKRFEADEPMSLEMFYTFDLGRLGPYVPPSVEMNNEEGEGYEDYEEEEEGEG